MVLVPRQEAWHPGQCILTDKPDWVEEEIPSNGGAYCAPAFLSPYALYYCIGPAVFVDTDGSQYLVYGGKVEGNWWSEDDPTYHYLAKGPQSLEDPEETVWIEAPF